MMWSASGRPLPLELVDGPLHRAGAVGALAVVGDCAERAEDPLSHRVDGTVERRQSADVLVEREQTDPGIPTEAVEQRTHRQRASESGSFLRMLPELSSTSTTSSRGDSLAAGGAATDATRRSSQAAQHPRRARAATARSRAWAPGTDL